MRHMTFIFEDENLSNMKPKFDENTQKLQNETQEMAKDMVVKNHYMIYI